MIRRLQRIKQLRVERAEQALSAQQGRVQAAHRRLEQARQAMLDYHAWRLDEEARLFALCQGTPLNRKELEAWQQQVALLREKEAALEQEAARMQELLAQERQRLSACQERLNQARRQAEKFSELARREQEDERAQAQYQEEQEQEEFRQHHRKAS
ncbi:type III secretion protein [Aeromonas schubertii]|uniref:Type III secretion system translocation protein n=1 Tax=Aeromonas schubertii TaxID=652 RepID=A0A0S2SGJ4_9GAMM|nr:type III secretion protein [Aeromonas schubertii]ALP40839.1 type III secretion system translocation protein [Aeromonas schubertii]